MIEDTENATRGASDFSVLQTQVYSRNCLLALYVQVVIARQLTLSNGAAFLLLKATGQLRR